MNGYKEEQVKKLFDELNEMDSAALKKQIEEYEEMKELSKATQDSKKESLAETSELYDLMLKPENFKKVVPTYKYEELDRFWELKLLNQRRAADNELARQKNDISQIDDELKLYDDLISKAKVLLKIAEEAA